MADDNGSLTREDIKTFIFDDLVEFLEETGAVNAVTPAEMAALIDEGESRVKGCMQEMVQEGVLERFKDEDEWVFRLSDDMVDELIEEMKADGWEPPEGVVFSDDAALTDEDEADDDDIEYVD